MAPLPPVSAVAQCRVFMETGTGGAMLHQCQNVHFFSWAAGAATEADMVAMAQNLNNGYANMFTGLITGGVHYISDDTTVTQASAIDLTSPTSPQGVFVGATPGAASQISLAQSAMLFRKPIGRRFRGGHGRTYLPGVTPDNTTDGRTWTPTAQSDLKDAFQEIITRTISGFYAGYPNISGLNLVEVSYIDKAVNPVPPYRRPVPLVDVVAVSTITADSVIRSQRRRVRLTPTPT